MRDPEGSVRFDGDMVVRDLRQPVDASHFLHSDLARRWVSEGHLVSYQFATDTRLVSPRIPFVTLPTEWCDAQFHAAARLTLQLQKEACAEGFDLKDASAWNVVFHGTRPVFCDLLSFERLKSREWWAAGQFTRHFLLPLLLSRRLGLTAHECLHLWRDGPTQQAAARLLGWRRFLGRHFLLMLPVAANASVDAGGTGSSLTSLQDIIKFRRGLMASLDWFLSGLNPADGPKAESSWSRYVQERGHYSDQSLQVKVGAVTRALETVRPAWVADLGCNMGEFSRLCLDQGASVVALDADLSCIQHLFCVHPNSRLFPVVSNLDDLSPARGWASSEFPSLNERLGQRFDLVMMLALIHHLLVSAAVRVEQIASWLHGCTREWLLLEYIGTNDSQLQLLCRQRRREPAEFSIEMQRRALLLAGFVTVQETELSASRVLALLRKQV